MAQMQHPGPSGIIPGLPLAGPPPIVQPAPAYIQQQQPQPFIQQPISNVPAGTMGGPVLPGMGIMQQPPQVNMPSIGMLQQPQLNMAPPVMMPPGGLQGMAAGGI